MHDPTSRHQPLLCRQDLDSVERDAARFCAVLVLATVVAMSAALTVLLVVHPAGGQAVAMLAR